MEPVGAATDADPDVDTAADAEAVDKDAADALRGVDASDLEGPF